MEIRVLVKKCKHFWTAIMEIAMHLSSRQSENGFFHPSSDLFSIIDKQ